MGTLSGGTPLNPDPPPRSFKDALIHHTSTSSSIHPTNPEATLTDLGKLGTHKGSPAIYYSRPQVTRYSDPYHQTLVAKFSQGFNKQNPDLGRPSLDKLHDFFVALDLHGEVQLGLLDNRHVLIRCSLQEDYLRIYSRPVWYVRGIPMRIFKWTPGFHVERESPIAPVWISFPRLPSQFFNSEVLFQLCRLIGTPLRMDTATQLLKRPSLARVQIELDVQKPRPEKVWIGMEGLDGFWQRVEYENVPDYCSHCWHVGHSDALCHVHNPALKPSDKQSLRRQKQIYIQKHSSVQPEPDPATDPNMTQTVLPPLPNPHAAVPENLETTAPVSNIPPASNTDSSLLVDLPPHTDSSDERTLQPQDHSHAVLDQPSVSPKLPLQSPLEGSEADVLPLQTGEIGFPLSFEFSPAPTGPVTTGLLFVSKNQHQLISSSSHALPVPKPWQSVDHQRTPQDHNDRASVFQELRDFNLQMKS